MSKTKSSKNATTVQTNAEDTARHPEAEAKPAAASKKASKQDAVIALMERPDGASVAEIIAITNWQVHSVRGFVAGTVKKKFGLTVVKGKAADGAVTYRIVDERHEEDNGSPPPDAAEAKAVEADDPMTGSMSGADSEPASEA